MLSLFGVKTYALPDVFDAWCVFTYDIEKLLGRLVPIKMITHSESPFNVIIKSSEKSEKCVMIYIEASLEAYHKGDICYFEWTASGSNIAYGHSQSVLYVPRSRLFSTPDDWTYQCIGG